MAANENRWGQQQLIGNVDLPLVALPSLRGSIRRSDPDGGHAQPYFASLTGTRLTVVLSPVGGTVNVDFTTDNYQDALDAINAASPTHLSAADDEGFLRVSSKHAGGTNSLQVNPCTAAAILGYEVFPIPGSISYVGEIDSAPSGGSSENNANGTKGITHDEDVISKSFNRAIFGALSRHEFLQRELDREFVTVIRTTASFYTHPITGDTVFKITDPTVRIPLKAFGIVTSQATTPIRAMDNIVMVQSDLSEGDIYLSAGSPPVYAHGLAGARLRFNGAFYANDAQTLDDSASFAVWGTPDGKSIFGGTAHWQKSKQAATNITSINGNVIHAAGALFVTKNVQAGDTLVLSGAVNTAPFDPNGEYIVEAVFSETALSVRGKSPFEDLVFGSNNRPTALNTTGSSGLGQVSVPVGFFLPATTVTFRLDRPGFNGTLPVRIAVGKQLRTQDITAFVRDAHGNSDEFYNALYDHLTNAVSRHPASAIDYGGSGPFVDTETLPAAPVETTLDTLVSKLADTSTPGHSGAEKIGSPVLPSSHGHNVTSGSVRSQLKALLEQMDFHLSGLATYRHTANQIDASAGPVTRASWTVNAQDLQSWLAQLVNAITDTLIGAGLLNVTNQWTATNDFLDRTTFGGQLLLTLNNAAKARQTIQRATNGVSKRTLIQNLPPSSGHSVRIYRSQFDLAGDDTECLELAFNCVWGEAIGPTWAKDVINHTATLIRFGRNRIDIYRNTAGNNSAWVDTAGGWDGGFPLATWDYALGNSDMTDARRNVLAPKSMTKSWGYIFFLGGGAFTLVGGPNAAGNGWNVQGAAFAAGGTDQFRVIVTLSVPLINTSYHVNINPQDVAQWGHDATATIASSGIVVPNNKTTTAFQLSMINPVTGSLIHLQGGATNFQGGIGFDIYGIHSDV